MATRILVNQPTPYPSPVHGFNTIYATMALCVKTQMSVILELEGWLLKTSTDCHNRFGAEFLVDMSASDWYCVFSTETMLGGIYEGRDKG